MTVRAAGNNNDRPAIFAPSALEFQIADIKMHVPVVTLSKENDKKLLQQLKPGFKRTVKWNKYKSQMTVQRKNNKLNSLIDPTFTTVNRLFILSFQRTEENNVKKDHRDSFTHYYVPNVEINNFNVLIGGYGFFDFSVKNEEEAYEKIIEMSRNNDYTTGDLLDFAYSIENYRLIAMDLTRQTKLQDPQQINLIGELEDQNNGVTMSFIIEKCKETTLEFLQNYVNIL